MKYTAAFANIASFLLFVLFIYAAASKLKDFESFSTQLAKSPVTSLSPAFLAISVPALELLISIGLAIKRFQLVSLYASLMLMVMFSAYIVIILHFSPYIPCSCGGVLQQMTWTEHLIFNITFSIMAAAGILLSPGSPKVLTCVSRRGSRKPFRVGKNKKP